MNFSKDSYEISSCSSSRISCKEFVSRFLLKLLPRLFYGFLQVSFGILPGIPSGIPSLISRGISREENVSHVFIRNSSRDFLRDASQNFFIEYSQEFIGISCGIFLGVPLTSSPYILFGILCGISSLTAHGFLTIRSGIPSKFCQVFLQNFSGIPLGIPREIFPSNPPGILSGIFLTFHHEFLRGFTQ